MTPPRGICEVCGRAVLETQRAAWPVHGWQLERSGGGANQIAGRTRVPDRIAHATCLERALKYGDQTQMELT